MGSGIPKRTSGHLDRYFFVRCPEVGLGFVFFAIVRTMVSRIPNPTSGHLGRPFLFLRCPEVGLEFSKLGVPTLFVFTLRCPEVQLGIPNLTSGHL